jgi:hypothetical protein
VKYKGSRIQYEFNAGILEGFRSVKKSLLEENLVKATAEIDTQMSGIEKRNKLKSFCGQKPTREN